MCGVGGMAGHLHGRGIRSQLACSVELVLVIVWEVLFAVHCISWDHAVVDLPMDWKIWWPFFFFPLLTPQWQGDASGCWGSTVHCDFFVPLFLEPDSCNTQKVTDVKCYVPWFFIIWWCMDMEGTVKNLSLFCVLRMLNHETGMCTVSGVVYFLVKQFDKQRKRLHKQTRPHQALLYHTIIPST
jgi:hypothetical protein